MAVEQKDIRAAKEMLASHGLLKDFSPRDLATASTEIGKGLKETLEYLASLWRGR